MINFLKQRMKLKLEHMKLMQIMSLKQHMNLSWHMNLKQHMKLKLMELMSMKLLLVGQQLEELFAQLEQQQVIELEHVC
jgi:hypothetical protein